MGRPIRQGPLLQIDCPGCGRKVLTFVAPNHKTWTFPKFWCRLCGGSG